MLDMYVKLDALTINTAFLPCISTCALLTSCETTGYSSLDPLPRYPLPLSNGMLPNPEMTGFGTLAHVCAKFLVCRHINETGSLVRKCSTYQPSTRFLSSPLITASPHFQKPLRPQIRVKYFEDVISIKAQHQPCQHFNKTTMTAIFNVNSFPPYPSTPGAASCPGTPMSGISTVAIKDGHEGISHGHHERDPAALERMAKLGAYEGVSSATGSVGEDGGGYFERVAGWWDHDGAVTAGEPPEEQRGLSGGELTGESSRGSFGRIEPSNDTPGEDFHTPSSAGTPLAKPSLTQNLADKLVPKAKLPIPPRRSPSSYSTQVPNPPCPTPVTPLSIVRNPLSQVASTHPGPNNNNVNNNTKSNSNSSTPASGSGLYSPYTVPSPASTLTTNSVREAKHHAKMLGPMTYDEGIVDTTSQNGSETTRSPSPPIVLNQGYILEGGRVDLDERGEGSRKERLEDIEERIVGGEHGAFRD